jgi:hypothetical protein
MFIPQPNPRKLRTDRSKEEEEKTELTIIEHKNKQKTAGPMTFEILETG